MAPLGVDLGFQGENVPQRRVTMFADVAKGQIADIHPVDHQRARDAEDARRVARAQFLVLGQDRDPFTLRQMAEERFDQ